MRFKCFFFIIFNLKFYFLVSRECSLYIRVVGRVLASQQCCESNMLHGKGQLRSQME
jgi:hypothetical protein